MTLAIATSASSVATASLTIAATEPSGIADGDVLVAFVAKSTNATPTTIPAGWTVLLMNKFINNGGFNSSAAGNVGTGWVGIYWKIAASESGPYTWGSVSSTWNVQTVRITGYAGIKPGGVIVGSAIFLDMSPHARTTTTIDQTNIAVRANMISDNILLISQWAHVSSAVTPVLSAIPGTMSTLVNSSQAGLAQVVAWEYLDVKTTPVVGNRAVTTSSATGTGGGWAIMLADPPSVTGAASKASPRANWRTQRRSRLVN